MTDGEEAEAVAWQLTIFDREGDVLVVEVDLPDDLSLLREICAAPRDDAMMGETEVPGPRVRLLERFGAIPIDPARYSYFVGEVRQDAQQPSDR